tara:strand:+ start:4464 stop:4760 length:297 start_codon:yes stop_codon:yes gene_type:complete
MPVNSADLDTATDLWVKIIPIYNTIAQKASLTRKHFSHPPLHLEDDDKIINELIQMMITVGNRLEALSVLIERMELPNDPEFILDRLAAITYGLGHTP